MGFANILDQHDWHGVHETIHATTEADVRAALRAAGRGTWRDFLALISPAAAPFLEQMARTSQRLTRSRFGNTIGLYIPVYLSSKCQNSCVYCGFNVGNRIERRVLTDEEILREVEYVKSHGFDHVLLVTGESDRQVGAEYFAHVLDLVSPHFASISIEVQPLAQGEYEDLRRFGLNTVYIYQETYNRKRYPVYHPHGPKADFDYRLATPERLGNARVHRVGLGCLLGLEDWRVDSSLLALHLRYLEKQYWRTKFSISFPRLRPAAGGFQPDNPISDRELVQLICAYRIFDENVELSLSTRESADFRDHAIPLGITNMSAGSRTDPGGYTTSAQQLAQFDIHDDRPPHAVAAAIRARGYEAVWKDWDRTYSDWAGSDPTCGGEETCDVHLADRP